MKNKYYEIVFEGHYKAIFGLLEGFMLASNKKEWNFYFCDRYGIKAETLTEILLDWITLKTKLHHVIINESFYNEFIKAVKNVKDSKFVNIKYIRSSQIIKSASFTFDAKTYGMKYGNEIKAILKNLNPNLKLHDYTPLEKVNEEARGIEMYAPEHDYIFEAKGRIEGDMIELIGFRKKLDNHPLIKVDEINLSF